MCGINGVLIKEKDLIESLRQKITKMNNLIIHRGPDDDGIFLENNDKYSIGMGMRRLSIIDLEYGKQPIFNDDKSITIVFNGEIYNYKILKRVLEKEGVIFKTSSDTEVVLRLFERHGVSSFGMLDGMFALSIYDKKSNKLFIARDFFGEKPLYYTCKNNHFYWASELKSIVKVLPITPILSKKSLSLYFQLTYIPAPFTIYENIFKLEANHYLEFGCETFELKINKVEQQPIVDYGKISFSEAKKITHDLVQKSVESRAISDVPIGAFLSGGVDSSIVSHCLSQHSSLPIDTFSIGFSKKSFDETDKSRLVAKLLGSNHHEFMVPESDLQNDIDFVLLNFDEPFADSSALPTYMVSKLTQKSVKVALTGDGGDEVFGGYNKYYMGKLNYRYTKLIPEKLHFILNSFTNKIAVYKDDQRGLRFKLNRLINAIDYEHNFYFNIISLGFQKYQLSKLIKTGFLCEDIIEYYKTQNISSLKDFRDIDKRISLEGDMLVKVDRSSMLTSIECRSPFLNKGLWDFTNQLPDDFLIKGWNKKYLLKESFKHYFPENFLDKTKKGFQIPIGDWLRGLLKKELLSYIEYEFLKKQNIFKIEYVRSLVQNHIEGKVDNTFRVWTFYCFQKWYSKNFFI